MSEAKKVRILRNVLGDFKVSGQERLFYCPSCEHHKKKLSVNVEKNVFKCWICDWSGKNIYRIIRSYGDSTQKAEWRRISNRIEIENFSEILFGEEEQKSVRIIDLPKSFKTLVHGPYSPSGRDALNYLFNRGLTKEDIIWWRIGYAPSGKYGERIIIPSFNKTGDINYFIARAYTGHPNKYMNPPASKNVIFNEVMLDFDEELVITEGVFDAIKAGRNSIPLLGSTLREESHLFQKLVRRDTPIYLGLDDDAKDKQAKLINLLLQYGLEVFDMHLPPGKDLGELTRGQIDKLKKSATAIDPENYLLMSLIQGI